MSLLDSISSSTDRASDDNSGNGSSGKGSKSGNDSSDKDSNSGKHNNKSNNKDNSRDDNNDNNDKKSKPSKSKSNSDDDGLDSMTSKSKSISANVTATSGDQPSGDSSSSSNDVAAMVGILVGVAVLIIVIVAIIVVCVKRRKKKKKPQEAQQYYNNDPKGQYNPNWYNNNHPMSNASSGVMPPQGGWQMPPPPPGMMSSDMSGGYSSGPMGPPTPPPHPGISLGFNKSTFSYEELAAATQGFSQANVLGQGGFGFVHKGVFPNGKEVAVKSLKSGSGQGEREFQAEVEIISRVHHRHLVSLVGYCISGGQRMLVYEFVPNGTLEYHLHGKGRPVMKFESRIKIALGSAKGLAYLHEDCHPRIIHRDIKTANILIDDTFEAKVADFGLAKLSSDNYTHVSTRVMGTFGYLAPEYAASGKLTDKSDVFSFGVMLLELVTGRRPINPTGDEDSLVDWARPQLMRTLDEERFEGLVDPKLENNFNPSEMTRMAACAAAAIRHSSKRRPRMSQIVRALEGDMPLDALNGDGAVKPGQSTNFGSGDSTSYDANSYQKDMKKFMMTLNEEDYTSSEYESSQEYGRGSGNGFSSESRGGGGRNKSFM